MGVHTFSNRSKTVGDRKKTMAFCFSPTCVKNWLSINHPHYIKSKSLYQKYSIKRRKLVLQRVAARSNKDVWGEAEESALQKLTKCYHRARHIVSNLEENGDPILNGIPKPDVDGGVECPQCGWALRWVPKLQEDNDVQSYFRGDGGFSTVEFSAGFRKQYSELIRNSERDTAGELEEEIY